MLYLAVAALYIEHMSSSSSIRGRLEADLRSHGGILSEPGLHLLASRSPSVLLESHVPATRLDESLLFVDPVDTIRARRVQEVLPALVRAQVMLEQGKWIAGYVSYEASPAFLPVPARDPHDDPPYLVWFGVFDPPVRVRRPRSTHPPMPLDTRATIGEVHPDVRYQAYERSFSTVQRYLRSGNSYQVNLTFPVRGRWSGSSAALYARLRAAQPVGYAGMISHDGLDILSLSPELFFSVRGDTLTLRPMKGTAPRGRTAEEDQERIKELASSEKDRAENRMIVDLLRNDAGRIAVPGSVQVRSFFDIEVYPSIVQATSTVESRLKGRLALVDAFNALFPSGSVTGAPKIETMRIIHEIEEGPRGVYTGAIGCASPQGDMAFSVAIRTAEVNERMGEFSIHVGSGVTVASGARREYEECLQKALFVAREPVGFELFETMLWTPRKGFVHPADHLRRMEGSCKYFGWPFSAAKAREYLREVHEELLRKPLQEARVRLRYGPDLSFAHDVAKLGPLPLSVLTGFSSRTISSDDRFQFHKTTHRRVYDEVLEDARVRGWFDAIVMNERGEVAEGARTNVFIEKDGLLLTPPISSGILAGTMRRRILASKQWRTEERTLTKQDVLSADRVFLTNALRGMVEAVVVP